MELKDYEDILKLEEYIESRNVSKIKEIMEKYNLEIKGNKLVPRDKKYIKELSKIIDFRQYATKILLNSVYGSLLNQHMKYADQRIGQSVTMTGRCITKHMNAKINEILTGDYNHKGEAIIYGDTDSVSGDTIIKTNIGDLTIENLFEICEEKKFIRNKEYAFSSILKVLTFNPENFSLVEVNFDYVYRHFTKKKIYLVRTDDGKEIKVTEDHSLLIWNKSKNKLIKCKPSNVLKRNNVDIIVLDSFLNVNISKIKEVVEIGEENNHVYDIGINKNTPWFFGNDILVHNSSYFSAYHLEYFKDINWTKENAIKLYDEVANILNESFNEFMKENFNVKEEFSVIKAGREIVASKGYFITKKRYALLYFDKEGIRFDKDGKSGKLKVMGLDLKRSDTPKFVQTFLEEIIYDILENKSPAEIFEKIKNFKKEFRKKSDWEKGYPKKVNKLLYYTKIYEDANNEKIIEEFERKERLEKDKFKKNQLKKYISQLKSPRIPGHVMASINWNKMKRYYKDNVSPDITDGAKVLVFYLKPNLHKIDSIAIPVDLDKIPKWMNNFKVDTEKMEDTIVNKKIKNIFAALEDWNVDPILDNSEINNLFEF